MYREETQEQQISITNCKYYEHDLNLSKVIGCMLKIFEALRSSIE